MTKEEFAQRINGREYGYEIIRKGEARELKENGLIAVYGYSDDNCEFEGVINEEIPCWEGARIFFSKDAQFSDRHGIDLFDDDNEIGVLPNEIKAVWCPKNEQGEVYASWAYETDIPHTTFDILEGDFHYCRGIVFSVNDLK